MGVEGGRGNWRKRRSNEEEEEEEEGEEEEGKEGDEEGQRERGREGSHWTRWEEGTGRSRLGKAALGFAFQHILDIHTYLYLGPWHWDHL